MRVACISAALRQALACTLQGEFSFPYSVCATEHEIFVADVANHRIQVCCSPGTPVMNPLLWDAYMGCRESSCESPCYDVRHVNLRVRRRVRTHESLRERKEESQREEAQHVGLALMA